jgi:hypothetical protein
MISEHAGYNGHGGFAFHVSEGFKPLRQFGVKAPVDGLDKVRCGGCTLPAAISRSKSRSSSTHKTL